jgi:tetratricopeptide (TPR) repeat protein
MPFLLKATLKRFAIVVFCVYSAILFAQQTPSGKREISGTITFEETPLAGATVMIANTNKGTKSSAAGRYAITAKPGDILVYSHLGYKTLKIPVEDVTSVLNVKMVLQSEKLDEVHVEATKNKDVENRKGTFGLSKKVTDAPSTFYIKGEDLGKGYVSVVEALANEGIPGVIFQIDYDDPRRSRMKSRRTISINNSPDFLWDVDGVTYKDPPTFLDITMIKDVRVIKSLSDLALYGSAGAGGVVVIRTNNATNMDEVKKKNIAAKYYNNTFYNNDAVTQVKEIALNKTLLNEIKTQENGLKAFNFLKKEVLSDKINFHQALEASLVLKNHFKNYAGTVEILQILQQKNKDNPEYLKAIGYYLQEMGRKKEAIAIFESLIKLRPTYLQSYRDLANAYTEDKQYKKAWRMFISYLNLKKNIGNLEISNLINSEMEWLYFLKKDQADIKTKFLPKSTSVTDFQNDIRLVVEWNTSDADFVLEFVNPDNRVFNFNHTLQDNQDLILNEKLIGYSSSEFFINTLKEGQWLVNFKYLGNKKPEPAYFKFTLYRNWGKPNQTKKVIVKKCYKEQDKIQLLKLGKQLF